MASRLKQQYREFNLALGPVGAGLPPEEIKEGTELHDLVGTYSYYLKPQFHSHHCVIARLSVDFPHWKKLHSIWRTEPNVNPYAPSVELPTMEKPSSESASESDEIDTLVVNYMIARVNADLELEKLKHQERLLQMQHQREREKEQHHLRTLELQLALRESENKASVSARPFMPSPVHTILPATALNP
jgi:hypothetical protein